MNVDKVLTFTVCSVCLLFAASCWPLQKDDKKSGGDRLRGILNWDAGGYVERIEEKTAVNISFKTSMPAYCEIHLAPQSDPGKIEKVFVCDNTPKEKHFYTLNKLNPDTLYRFTFFLWIPGYGKEVSEIIEVDEKASGMTFFGGSKNSIDFPEIIISKINIPLGSAVIFRKKLLEVTSVEEIQKMLSKDVGCNSDKKSIDLLSPTDSDHQLSQVSTFGFASSAQSSHSTGSSVYLEFGDRVQYGSLWQWNYRDKDSSFDFQIRPPGELRELEVESKDFASLGETDLDRKMATFKSITLDSGFPLMVRWKAINPDELSYILISLQNRFKKEESSVHCQFPVLRGYGSISANLLSRLESGQYFLQATLVHYVIKEVAKNQPFWLIASYDWRAMVVEKR